jgi:hypothetical protein
MSIFLWAAKKDQLFRMLMLESGRHNLVHRDPDLGLVCRKVAKTKHSARRDTTSEDGVQASITIEEASHPRVPTEHRVTSSPSDRLSRIDTDSRLNQPEWNHFQR